MKNTDIKIFVLLLGIVFLGACSTEDDLREDIINNTPNPFDPPVVEADPGSLNLSKYVSVGNSITAGLMDAALYVSGMEYSFPNQLAGQFALAGGGNFVQPLVDGDRGFNISLNSLDNPSNASFGRFLLNLSVPGPEPLVPGEPLTPYAGPDVNNFGVPGARVVDLTVPQYGLEDGGNYFYFRFASNPGTSTILNDAIAAQGTIQTLWIGNNDILGWLVDGGNGPDGDVTPGAELNPLALTGTATFELAFGGVLSAMTAGGTPTMVLNIPNILATPFFQAVPWNSIPLDQATVDQLNAGFSGVNDALDGLAGAGLITQAEADQRKVTYSVSENNPILGEDDALEDLGPKFDLLGLPADQRAGLEPFRQSRPLTENDFVQLFAGLVLGEEEVPGDPTTVTGVALPLGDEWFISPDEALIAETRRATFNAIIEAAVASDANAELVDAAAKYDEIVEDFLTNGGYEINGLLLTPDFAPNGIYSVDGIHPNPRGHGIIANEVIKVLNDKYGASLPEVDVLNLPGITGK